MTAVWSLANSKGAICHVLRDKPPGGDLRLGVRGRNGAHRAPHSLTKEFLRRDGQAVRILNYFAPRSVTSPRQEVTR